MIGLISFLHVFLHVTEHLEDKELETGHDGKGDECKLPTSPNGNQNTEQ